MSYTYDNEGQLANAGGTGLTFDYNHRLAAIGSDTQFSYDGRGNRLSATRAGVTTRYIYDPWGNLMAEADSNGVTHKYIYGKGLLAVATSSARYCYHFNGTGSTVALTDMTQAVVNSYAYEPFGQILGQQETIPQPFKFVGQYGVMAEPNGLYYMRARYYDPSVGRFISEDPLGFGGGDVNLYAYVRNNPINGLIPGTGESYIKDMLPGIIFQETKTASGDMYNKNSMTAAMTAEKADLGDQVTVQYGTREIAVTVNDRGPFERDCQGKAKKPLRPDPNDIIDLTAVAFKKLIGPLSIGKAPVTVEVPDQETIHLYIIYRYVKYMLFCQ